MKLKADLQNACSHGCVGRWRAPLNDGMNRRVPWNTGNFLTSWETVSFSRRTLHHRVSYGRVGWLLCSSFDVQGFVNIKPFLQLIRTKLPTLFLPSSRNTSAQYHAAAFFSWKILLLDSLVPLVPLTQLETIRPNLMFKDRYIYINLGVLQPPSITAKILRLNLLQATILKIQFALRSNH